MEIDWLILAKKYVENADGSNTIEGMFDNLLLKGPPPFVYSEWIELILWPSYAVTELGAPKSIDIQMARFMEGRGFEKVYDIGHLDWKVPTDLSRWVMANDRELYTTQGIRAIIALLRGVRDGRRDSTA